MAMEQIPMHGKAIFENAPRAMRNLIQVGLGTEIIYSFIIIFCSLMIYFGTKELYELTNHKGIKYFRLSFLFFAIAYFFRSFIKIILMSLDMREIREIAFVFGNITLFIFAYLSAMAILYLLYSVIYKKYKNKIYALHAIAILIALITIMFNSPTTYLLMNIALFIIIIIAIQSSSKKKNNLHIIYILLSIFWIFNILDILIPNMLQLFQLIIYLASAGIFLTILYKVLRSFGK